MAGDAEVSETEEAVLGQEEVDPNLTQDAGLENSPGRKRPASGEDEGEPSPEDGIEGHSPTSKGKQKAKRQKRVADDEEEGEDEGRHQSEAGIILKVNVQNFMCHPNLTVRMNRHINFITGQNGSGKSAVLCALQICLGASARVTHRGKGLKDLIRHGSHQPAFARVTLSNTGPDAYRPDEFGPKLTVERKILPSGTSEYRLLDHNGHLVSKKRSDLVTMLDRFNIQIDNPCAVLDQEEAKKFLKGDNKEKYSFFLRATDLKKMKVTYAEIEHEIEVTQTVMTQQEAKLETLRKEVMEAKKLCEEAGKMKELEEQVNMLKIKLVRTQLKEEEDKLTALRDTLQKAQAKYQSYLSEYERQREEELIERERLEAKQAEMQELNHQYQERKEQEDQLVREIQRLKKPMREFEAQLKGLDKRLQQQKAQHREAISELSRIQNEALNRNKDSQQRQQEFLLRAEEDLARKNNEHALHIEDRQRIQQELEAKGEEEHRCKEMLEQANHQYNQASGRLKALQSQRTNKAALFGARMGALLEAIQRNIRRFSAPPIGPIGMHVKLAERNKDWAKAIEACLGSTLAMFIVHRSEDKTLMDELRRQVGAKAGEGACLIAKKGGSRYNQLRLPEGELRAKAIALLIDVDNDEVYNALIDQTQMESKLVFQNIHELRAMMLLGPDGHLKTPKNVKEGYVPDGSKVYVRNGNDTFVASWNRGPSRLTTNVEDQIAVLEEQVQTSQREMNVHRANQQEIRRAINMLKQELAAVNKLINADLKQIAQAEDKIKDIRDAVAEDTEMDTSALEQEIQDHDNKIQSLMENREAIVERIEAKKAELLPYEQQLQAFRGQSHVDQFQEELARELEAMGEKLSDANKKTQVLHRKANQHKASAANLEKEFRAGEQNLLEVRAKTELLEAKIDYPYADKIRLKEPAADVRSALLIAKKRVEQHQAKFNVLDSAELFQRYDDLKRKLEVKQDGYEKVKYNSTQLRSMMDKRNDMWKKFQKSISTTVSAGFGLTLSEKNMLGSIQFDHKNQTLELKVNQNARSSTTVDSDVKTLSGGERSAVQLAFLSAVGAVSDCPFRIMDEFDVYMDNKNRTTALNNLVEMGLNNPGKQFIFITPNDISSIDMKKSPEKIGIVRMRPPRPAGPSGTTQSTINFGHAQHAAHED